MCRKSGLSAALILMGSMAGNVWAITLASNPNPPDQVNCVDPDVHLDWTGGDCAALHDVYFGTNFSDVNDASPSSAAYRGRQASTTYDPGELLPNTTYFWRVVEVNDLHPDSPWIGPVWHFSTTAFTAAHDPTPADGATCVDLNVVLSWTPGDLAVTHDLYFGAEAECADVNDLTGNTFRGSLTANSYQPGELQPCTTYCWRIVEVNEAASPNAWAGDLWSFTTTGPDCNCPGRTGRISGVKFHDLNSNGLRDSGEPGLQGWTIELSNGMTAVTDAQGYYSFDNLLPGAYTVSEMLQFGWEVTSPPAPYTHTVTVPGGQTVVNINFGNHRPCVDAPEGLVAWWPFDEESGTVANDLSGQILDHGTLHGGAAFVPASVGKVLGALDLNGQTGYVEVPDSGELNFGTGDLSFDAWVRLDRSNSGIRVIVDKRTFESGNNIGSGSVQGYAVVVYDGRLAMQLADGGTGSSGATWMNYVSSASITDANWHFIAVTVDRNDKQGMVFYMDGGVKGSFDSTPISGSLTNPAPLWIGRNADVSLFGGGYLQGTVDEIELFNRALDVNDLDRIYWADSAGKCRCAEPPYEAEGLWYDRTAKFNGLHVEEDSNCLVLDSSSESTTPFRYAWIANSGEGTVSKVDTTTGQEVGRYYSGPPMKMYDMTGYSYLSPSRVIVDWGGNCWVANRCLPRKLSSGDICFYGSVTRILANPPSGKETSLPGTTVSSPPSLLDWGKDWAVDRHYIVGTEPNAVPRPLTMDRDGYLWVGLHQKKCLWKLDPQDMSANLSAQTYLQYDTQYTNAPKPTPKGIVDLGAKHGWFWPYAMALARNGRIYVSSLEQRPSSGFYPSLVAEIDPYPDQPDVCQWREIHYATYGLAVDQNCDVWMASMQQMDGNWGCIQWDPTQGSNGFTFCTGAPSRGRGITVHPDGGVWMACDFANKIARYDPSNSAWLDEDIPPRANNYNLQPVGVGVDADGNIIITCQRSNSWIRAGMNSGGSEIVMKSGHFGVGRAPYTYSDFTGSQANMARQQGFWTVVFDSGQPGTPWGTVSWSGNEPLNTGIWVEVRAGDQPDTYVPSTWTEVQNYATFTGISGRYLQVHVCLWRQPPPLKGCDDPNCPEFPESPALCWLKVKAKCTPCRIGCPNDITIRVAHADPLFGKGDGSVLVNYPLPETFGDCTQITCDPPSGSIFEPGTTTVTCTACCDYTGLPITCSFNVNVPLPSPTGACCYDKVSADGTAVSPGHCDIVTQHECMTHLHGHYMGDGSACGWGCQHWHDPITKSLILPHCVAWWSLDEDAVSGAHDLVGQLDATAVAGRPTPVPGKVDAAWSFDGRGDMLREVSRPELNIGTGNLTVEAWINTLDTTDAAPIVDKRTSAQGYALFLNNGALALTLNGAGMQTTAGDPRLLVADGQWHHIAVTIDRDRPDGCVFYLDGVAVAQFASPTRSVDATNDADLLIAASHSIGSPQAFFEGAIDELALYNTALPGEQIRLIVDANGAGKPKEFAHVTRWVAANGGTQTGPSLTIVNLTAKEQQYTWFLDGYAGEGCTMQGPSGASGLLTVPARSSRTVEVPYNMPSGLWGLSGTACSQITAVNPDTQTIMESLVTFWSLPDWDIQAGPADLAIPCCGGERCPAARLEFQIAHTADSNPTPVSNLSWAVVVQSPGGSPDNECVSLNGFAPGMSLTGTSIITPGKSISIPVDVAFLRHTSLATFDVVLLLDLYGDGTLLPVHSVTAKSVPCAGTLGQ